MRGEGKKRDKCVSGKRERGAHICVRKAGKETNVHEGERDKFCFNERRRGRQERDEICVLDERVGEEQICARGQRERRTNLWGGRGERDKFARGEEGSKRERIYARGGGGE